MDSRRIGSIDLDTGEILEGVPVWTRAKIKSPYGSRWVMTSQDAVLELAKDKDLSGRPLRVLLYLIANLDFENWIQIQQKDIAEELDLNKANVSRAIKVLEEKRIVLRGPKVDKSSSFRLNPNYGWKGKVKNLEKERNARLRLVKQGEK